MMKKKLALLCMAGIMVFGVTACGEGKTGQEVQETGAASGTDSSPGEENTGNEDAESGNTKEENTGNEDTEVVRVSDRPDYVGLQDLDIDTYVTLADYKNMKVSAVRPSVDDEGITEYINTELLVGNITNRAVQEGDVADIDYVGKKDGVAFEGGTASGYQLEIGSGSFIPGFEEGLVGVMPGETVDLNLTFPENYRGSAELAGQEVVFTVTVNGIKGSADYGTVTPEEMENMGLSYRTKEEVWDAGKAAVEKNSEEVFAANSRNAVVQKVVEESTVQSVPEYLVEEEEQNYNLYMESFLKALNMDLESFVTSMYGMTMEQYNAELKEMCSDTIRQYMVMEAVARAEGIEVTDEMISERADEEAAGYGYASGEELVSEVGFTTYRMSILQDRVVERLMEVVTVEAES